ncbi:MAG: helix-turn-helix domain-containing protein [Acidimicrobiia bacterium]
MTVVMIPGAGGLLRDWRQRRRLSQQDLALAAEVSARHLSFVETGRSTPSRELILHLAAQLEVPLRDRNALLLAAGYAPVYHETPFDADEMAPVREALDKIARGHEPFPAVVVDRHWDLVTLNDAALALLTAGVASDLLVPPVNALRISLHPDGIAKRIVNLTQWSGHLLARLDRQIAVTGAPGLIGLAAELRSYPGISADRSLTGVADRLFVPLVLSDGDRELQLFSTVATFGTPLDITVAELAIESFFPADAATAHVLATVSAGPRRGPHERGVAMDIARDGRNGAGR